MASEVRKLAERTQSSATGISTLAASSVSVADRAGSPLGIMVPDIRRTAELVREISVSSAEQRSGTDQIAKAVGDLDAIVQRNAALAEQVGTLVSSLAAEAGALEREVGYFSVDGESDGSRTRQARSATWTLPTDVGLRPSDAPSRAPGRAWQRLAKK